MRFPFDLRSDTRYDAVGFGTNAVDYLIRVPVFPAFAAKVELSDFEVRAGGEVASTMVGLRRLGSSTSYAGRFGGDREGELGRRSLVDEGVDIEYAETIGDARTQVAFILIDEATGERTIVWKRDAKLAYSRNEAPVDMVSTGRVLHMTPHDTAACVTMATGAKKSGVVVSLDIDKVTDGIDELLPLVDLCIASVDFPEKLTGIGDQRLALSTITERYGCSVTGLTRGAAGSVLYCDGKYIETKGFAVPGGCVDTTGAGDAFRTGFLHGLLTGCEVEEAAVMANAVAALKCRRPGARTGLPDKAELSQFLADAGV